MPASTVGEELLSKRFLVGLVAIMACGGDGAGPIDPGGSDVASVAITATPATIMTVGQQVQLSATAYDQRFNEIPDAEIAWSSADNAIATVSGSGLVTGVSEGVTNVMARS